MGAALSNVYPAPSPNVYFGEIPGVPSVRARSYERASRPYGGVGWQARPREITLHSFTCNIALVLVLEKEVGTSWHWKRACLPGGADATWGLPAGFQPHSTPALPSALEHQQCIRSPLAGGEYTSLGRRLARASLYLTTRLRVSCREAAAERVGARAPGAHRSGSCMVFFVWLCRV